MWKWNGVGIWDNEAGWNRSTLDALPGTQVRSHFLFTNFHHYRRPAARKSLPVSDASLVRHSSPSADSTRARKNQRNQRPLRSLRPRRFRSRERRTALLVLFLLPKPHDSTPLRTSDSPRNPARPPNPPTSVHPSLLVPSLSFWLVVSAASELSSSSSSQAASSWSPVPTRLTVSPSVG